MIGGRRRGGPQTAHVMALVDSAHREQVLGALQPLAGIAPLLGQQVWLQRYRDVMTASTEPHHSHGEPRSRSILVEHFTPRLSRDIGNLLESGAVGVLSVRSAGGAVADIPAVATAYAGRNANFAVVALGS